MFKFHQKTTKLGVGLIGTAAAVGAGMLTGNVDLINFSFTDTGVEVSGLAGSAFTLISGLAGLALGFFDEDKKRGGE